MTAGRRSGARAPGRHAPRRADAVRNQEAIVEAAMRVLAEQPGASMAEIAEASRLGRATLYRHFRSRPELVRAIQRQALVTASGAIAGCGLEARPAPEALRCAVEALVGVGDRYRVLGREASLDPRLLERQQSVARPLLEAIRRGQRRGELRRDVPAAWVLASMGSLLVLALREIGAGRLTPDAASAAVTATLLEGVAASGS